MNSRFRPMAWSVIVIMLAASVLIGKFWDRRPVLVCLGDSLTSCGGPGGRYSDWLARRMPDVRIINAGLGGDTLEGGRARFVKDVLRHEPDVCLIALGANDFWCNARPVEEMARDLEEMILQARENHCNVVIADCFGDRNFWEEPCIEFGPRRFGLASQIAAMERELCEKHGCAYIPNLQIDIKPNRLPPFWDETDHPGKAGNRQVALRLLPVLRCSLADFKAHRKRK